MAKSGQNVNNIKYANRSLLLNILYFKGTQSRKALSQKAGLTAAAITMIINELIEDGAVIETEKVITQGRLGRNEQLIDLNYKSLFVVGIQFSTDSFEICLTRLDSKVTASEQYSISIINGSFFGEKITDIILEIINKRSISIEQVVGIGATIKGLVDTENGISLNSYGVLENNWNISDAIGGRLNIPVTVDNNVRSMLRADIVLRHAQPAQSTLFIKYGPGVGGALLVGQKSYLGSKFNAIELGHICMEPDGGKCICGKNGCLETLISFESILNSAKQLFSEDHTPVLFRICGADKAAITIENIFQAYEKDDKGVERVIDAVIKYLCLSVSNCASLFDPETVLLSSEMFANKKFVSNLQKSIYDFSGTSKPRYLIISDNKKLEASGPSSIAINNFLATGGLSLRTKIIAEKERTI